MEEETKRRRGRPPKSDYIQTQKESTMPRRAEERQTTEVRPEDAKQRAQESSQRTERLNQETQRLMDESKPTPTQEENDRAKLGEVIEEKEDDGSPWEDNRVRAPHALVRDDEDENSNQG
jgi:hypothetical protein